MTFPLTSLGTFLQVVLFMKGNPDQPKCGFSQKTVALLKSEGVAFGESLQRFCSRPPADSEALLLATQVPLTSSKTRQ